ncbi:MAG: NCS1 family nucleobase:cation symporter-1, partial [Comamonadaceae bacterium]
PQVIHYTLDVLGSFIGPLFGILIADYYFVRRQTIVVDDLYTMKPEGRYWYSKGYNPKAVMTMIPSALIPILCVIVPSLRGAASYAWFIGMGLGFVIYLALNRKS